MRQKLYNHRAFFFYVLAVLSITFLSYSRLVHAYFLNDEWMYIAGVKTEGLFYFIKNASWFELLTGVNRPLGTFIDNFFYLYFHSNPLPFVFFGLTTHILNCILLYALIKKISHKTAIALAGSIFFAASSAYVQTLGWLACTVEVPCLTLFTILALYFLLQCIETKQWRWSIASFFSAYIAFLFKDAGVFLFLGLPLMVFIYERKLTKRFIPFYLLSFGAATTSILTRIYGLSTFTPGKGRLLYSVESLKGGIDTHLRLLYDIFVYPLIGIIQLLLPTRLIQKVIAYKQIASVFTITHIQLAFCLLALLLLYGAYRLLKQHKTDFRPLLSIAVLYALCFIPLALYIPSIGTNFIDGRFLYLSGLFFSIVMGYVLFAVIQAIEKYQKSSRVIWLFILALLCCGYVLKQISLTRSILSGMLYDQTNIKTLVLQLEEYQQKLPDRPIIYIDSDYDYFWPNNKVPFQEGTGFMLMTLFYDSGRIPPELIRNRFLINFGTQGYQTVTERGFGYYYDEKDLAKLYTDHPSLDIHQIVAFRYVSRTQRIEPITKDIQEFVVKNR